MTPDKAAQYFHKTACFCFNEQTLERRPDSCQFPLSFWVDPAIRDRSEHGSDVRTITLSYTFFRSLDDAARNGGLETRQGLMWDARADATVNPALNTRACYRDDAAAFGLDADEHRRYTPRRRPMR